MTGRDRIAIIVVVTAAALAAYWFLLFAPKREEASALGAKVTTQRQRLQTAQTELAASQAARATYAANYAAVAELGKAVPPDDDIASLVYQLDSTAGASSIDFRSIKLVSTNAGVAATPAPSAAGATPVAAPSQATTAALPPGASVGPAGLATMPFTFSFDGQFRSLAGFFDRVDHFIDVNPRALGANGRLVMINGFSMTFSQGGYPRLKANVAATAYLLPAGQGLTNGGSPSAPAQSGAQPASSPGAGAPTTTPATASTP